MSTHQNTLKRSQRLLLAKQWLANNNGKNKVRGYAKHFGVDLLCAIKELRLLDVEVSLDYENAVKNSCLAISKKKNIKNEQPIETDHDDVFGYIAGYTSGGAPYGLTWEEMEQGD